MRHHLLYVGIIAAITLSGCSRDNNDIMPPSSVPDINTGIEEVKPVQKIQLLELKVGKANNGVQQPFTIKYPHDWIMSTSDYDPSPSYFVQFEKDNHRLEISNLPRGGGACLFVGDEDFNGPHADYRNEDYKEFSYSFGTVRTVRKSGYYDKNRDTIEFCQKHEDRRYASITSIGDISFDIPKQSNQVLIEEMYGIVASATLTQ